MSSQNVLKSDLKMFKICPIWANLINFRPTSVIPAPLHPLMRRRLSGDLITELSDGPKVGQIGSN